MQLEDCGDMNTVESAKDHGGIISEGGPGCFRGPDFYILSEWSQQEAPLLEVALEFGESPGGIVRRDFAPGLFGAKLRNQRLVIVIVFVIVILSASIDYD
jgi:hypothetical protein